MEFCSTPVFDNHGRLFGSISLCCLVEHQSSADLSLTLAIAREVGNSCSPTACWRNPTATSIRCTACWRAWTMG